MDSEEIAEPYACNSCGITTHAKVCHNSGCGNKKLCKAIQCKGCGIKKGCPAGRNMG